MFKTVLFDFDGTLINTHDLIIEGFNHISRLYNGRAFDESDHIKMLGKPLEQQIRLICPFEVPEATEAFKAWYAKNHDAHACGYEAVEDVLKVLRSEGYQLGIVTNNSQQGMQSGLDLLGLEKYFDVIITRDDVSECKPSPEGIQKALHMLKTAPQDCIYVGDSMADIYAARSAGVLPVLVGWTALTHDQIRSLSPVDLIESPFEILLMMQIGNEKVG